MSSVAEEEGGVEAPASATAQASSSALGTRSLMPTEDSPIDDWCNWAGITEGPFRSSFKESLGDLASIRDIAHISEGEWTEFVDSAFFQPLSLPDEPTLEKTVGSVIQKARLRYLRVAARSALALPASEPAPAAASMGPGPLPAVAGTEPPRKRIKLSNLIDSTAEADCQVLSPSQINEMFAA